MNYLYNGWEFPALPKLDDDKKEAFKYALIIAKDQRGAVMFFDTPVYFNGYELGNTNLPKVAAHEDFAILSKSYTSESNAWGTDFTENQYSASGTWFSRPIIWANFDILNADGSVYLAASEPVPVGSVTARNPAAMLMGFQLGTAIRRMRGK